MAFVWSTSFSSASSARALVVCSRSITVLRLTDMSWACASFKDLLVGVARRELDREGLGGLEHAFLQAVEDRGDRLRMEAQSARGLVVQPLQARRRVLGEQDVGAEDRELRDRDQVAPFARRVLGQVARSAPRRSRRGRSTAERATARAAALRPGCSCSRASPARSSRSASPARRRPRCCSAPAPSWRARASRSGPAARRGTIPPSSRSGSKRRSTVRRPRSRGCGARRAEGRNRRSCPCSAARSRA